MVFTLPRAFSRGGYILSPIAMIVSGTIQCISALKLVQTAKKLGICSYSLIAYKVLGQNGKYALDFMIAAT